PARPGVRRPLSLVLPGRAAACRAGVVAQPRERVPLPAGERDELPGRRRPRRPDARPRAMRRALLPVHLRDRHSVCWCEATTLSSSMPETSPHLLVRAARGEAVERPPVWAMRQAGRWDPEFRRIRDGLSFYEFSEHVEKATAA